MADNIFSSIDKLADKIVLSFISYSLLFIISAIGVFMTAYLIKKRIALESPVCLIGKDCLTVLNSKYNRLFFGMHNEYGGMLFYISFIGISTLMIFGVGDADLLMNIAILMLFAASSLSLFLIYLQWRVIRAWCFWCLMSAATVGLMDIIMIIAYYK